MAVGTIVKQHDTLPPLARQLRHDPADWKTEGLPVDLECAERVEWWFRHEELCRSLGGWQAVVSDAKNGVSWVPLLPEMTALPGLVAIDIKVFYDDGQVQTFPATADRGHAYYMVRESVEMPDAIAIPVIATVKNEVERFAVLPAVGVGPELVILTAQDGANAPGIYSNTGGAYELVSGGAAVGTVEVTPSATLPGAYVTELINLLAVDGLNQPGLYRWDGAAYVGSAVVAADVDSYLHQQLVASDTWVVVHGLGYEPAGIHIEDGAGNDMAGAVTHDSVNQLTIRFVVPDVGTARVG